MSTKYVEIWDSTSGGGYRFRVIEGGYKPVHMRAQNFNETVDGTPDIVYGHTYEIRQYSFKLLNSSGSDIPSGEEVYGNLDELIRLWKLNSPGGAPNNVLTIRDHFGKTFTCVFLGNMEPSPLSIWIDGPYSWYVVNCAFRLLTEPT